MPGIIRPHIRTVNGDYTVGGIDASEELGANLDRMLDAADSPEDTLRVVDDAICANCAMYDPVADTWFIVNRQHVISVMCKPFD